MPPDTDENHYKSLSAYPIYGVRFTITMHVFQPFCCCGLVYNISYLTITILDIIHRPIYYLKLNSTQLYRFVRTSQETHYVCTTTSTI
jgi:hypothetical protein